MRGVKGIFKNMSKIPSEQVIDLEGEATIAQVESIKLRLSELLADGGPILLVTERLERIDAVCLQLLLVFSKEVDARGQVLNWQKPSAVLQDSARLLGLSDQLGLNRIGS